MAYIRGMMGYNKKFAVASGSHHPARPQNARFPMKNKLIRILCACVALFPLCASCAGTLQLQAEAIAAGDSADVGLAIEATGSGERAAVRAGKAYPMYSIVKFPLALAVLERVDRGELRLDDTITITPADLKPDTISPLRERYEGQTAEVKTVDILYETIAHSDNNGCDILMRQIGGPGAVERYVQSLGITGMHIGATCTAMHDTPGMRMANTATPEAANRLLALFYGKELLHPDSHELLWEYMQETMTGPGRLRGPLPAGTVLAHRTGTGENPSDGSTTVNDIGIIVLPDKRPVFISVFVTGARGSILDAEKTIADLSQAAWDYYSKEKDGNPIDIAERGVRELLRLETRP
ncbi:class A beta-lactamase [Oxalobacter sp. OxGP1]|uniref:class A beta-lactamase n=1 Tax=Oxalobacter paeniformigenes TaxID=2946594 RepID=UPI0022AFC9A9|nr:class A beta-lactamase [Oxalobacter paeniformigenes]MCZ4052601.1 class A beta-lactamase [Oxalobacter paeniformigenes]